MNCYFYTTCRGEDTFVAPLCVECHDREFKDLGWFWPGAERGYGPFLFACEKCRKVIHDVEDEPGGPPTAD